MNNEHNANRSLYQTVKKMSPTILTALIATALGFLSLYASPVPMIQDFGKMLTIGMIISFVITILILMPIVFTRDKFFPITKKQKQKEKASTFEKFLYYITKKIIKLKWVILIIAFITAGLGIWADQRVDVETDIETFMPQDTKELQDIHELRAIMGSTDQVSIVYSSEDVLSDSNLSWVQNTSSSLLEEFPNEIVKTKSITTLLTQISNDQPINSITAKSTINNLPDDQVKLFINEDQTQGVITVAIKHLESETLETFIKELNEYLNSNTSDEMDVTVTGKAVIDVEMVSALTTGRYTITLLGMAAVFLGLLIIYRNPFKAIIPLFPILLIVGWSGGFMYLLGLSYTPLTATLGALIIGIGTEFTIIIMERFSEEKILNDRQEAVAISISKIGKPVLASALTTIGGFSALVISDFEILSNFGIMTIINLSLALLSTLIVMPAILSIQVKGRNKTLH